MAVTRTVLRTMFFAPEINIVPRRGVSLVIFGDGIFRSDAAELRVLERLLAHVIEPWVVSRSRSLFLTPVLFAHELLEIFHDQLLLLGGQFFAENVVQVSLLPLRYVAALQCLLQRLELVLGEIVFQDLLRHVLFLLVQLRMALARTVRRIVFFLPRPEIMLRCGARILCGGAAEF